MAEQMGKIMACFSKIAKITEESQQQMMSSNCKVP